MWYCPCTASRPPGANHPSLPVYCLQVPQYILEDSWYRGAPCRVICTQPRRISAISVAERVAAERGEGVGENVG